MAIGKKFGSPSAVLLYRQIVQGSTGPIHDAVNVSRSPECCRRKKMIGLPRFLYLLPLIAIFCSGVAIGQTQGRQPLAPAFRMADQPVTAPASLSAPLVVARESSSPAAANATAAVPDRASTVVTDLAKKLETLEAKVAELEKAKQADQEAKKKLPSVTINGVFQADGVAFDQDDIGRLAHGNVENGGAFRRARLSAKGAVTNEMDYFLQMDFGFFGRPTFTDVWADFKELGPLGTLRVGQWKQPFGLEVVSSFRYTTFMERSSSFQAFTPFRHLGVGLYDHGEDLYSTRAISYFRTGQDQFGGSVSDNGGNGLATRWTRLFWFDETSGEHYLNLGFAYFLNSPPNDRVRFRSIPEIFVGEFVVPAGEPIGTSGQPVPNVANGTPFFVDTGVVTGTRVTNTFGVEKLWVAGPWSWQSEYMGCLIDSTDFGSRFLHGGYSQVGYFLTGEHRPFDRKTAQIDRVIPHQNFSWREGSLGAWELAARWSYLDLTDGPILGGDMQNLTVGLNWYVNPYCKCVFNYIHSWTTSRTIRNGTILSNDFLSSQTNAFAIRCQLDF